MPSLILKKINPFSSILHRLSPTWEHLTRKNSLLKKIDTPPEGPTWKCHTFVIQGDLLDYNSEPLTEEVDLWY